jgi:hypothetical protein
MGVNTVPAIGLVLAIGGPPALAPPAVGAVPPIGVHAGIAGLTSSSGEVIPPDPTPVDPLTVTLSSPDDQAVVAIDSPTFAVGVDTSLEDPLSTYTLHLQYADNQDMTDATELTADFTAVDGGAFLASTSVPATTWWRARAGQGAVWRSAWTAAQVFTVSSTVPAAQASLSWTVDTAHTGRLIHLWHLDPPAAAPGEKITIYGEGFPDSGGRVLLGNVQCTVNSWNFVHQVGNPDDTRHITGADITAEHYEVVITVPSYATPGGPLEVTT